MPDSFIAFSEQVTSCPLVFAPMGGCHLFLIFKYFTMKKKIKNLNKNYFKPRFLNYPIKFLLSVALVFTLINTIYSQCTNCPSSSTFSGFFTATSNNLSGSYTCLAINGTYFVNQDVTFQSSSIWLGPSARIIVFGGATLEFNDCEVRGCRQKPD